MTDSVWRSAAGNKQSLEVDWRDFVAFNQRLAMAVVDAPKLVLDLLHATAKEVVLEDFPEFGAIHSDIFVRFPRLTYVEPIRNLRRARGTPLRWLCRRDPCSSSVWASLGFWWGPGLFGCHINGVKCGDSQIVPL